MPDELDYLVIAPRWKAFRYLFSDGNTLDVKSPYNADSTDREAALAEARRQFGPHLDRKIEGVARLPEETDE
jgi:hypothetical protein